jgi:hypothetical protein
MKPESLYQYRLKAADNLPAVQFSEIDEGCAFLLRTHDATILRTRVEIVKVPFGFAGIKITANELDPINDVQCDDSHWSQAGHGHYEFRCDFPESYPADFAMYRLRRFVMQHLQAHRSPTRRMSSWDELTIFTLEHEVQMI